MNTSNKGQLAVLKVEQRAAEKGLIVSKPTTETRYELLLDDGESIKKAQVKYANGKSLASGVVVARLEKRNGSSNKCHPYTSQDVDIMLVYVPKVDKVLCFDPAIIEQKTALYIRYEPAKGGQTKRCLFSHEHEW